MSLFASGRKLRPEHRRFAEEWVIDFNRVRAYRAAGYEAASETAARSGAGRLLAREDISDYIRDLMDDKTAKLQFTGEMVLERIRQIAFADLGDFVQIADDGKSFRLKDLNLLPASKRAAIGKITQKSAKGGIFLESIELRDSIGALKMLAKYFGVDLSPQELLTRVRGLGFELKDTFAETVETEEDPLAEFREGDTEGEVELTEIRTTDGEVRNVRGTSDIPLREVHLDSESEEEDV